MNSNLKILLAVAALVLGVFGVTVISNYTNRETSVADRPVDNPQETQSTNEAVRSYGTTQIVYDPTSEHRAHREFPGYFEVNDEEHPVTFWVQNINPVPVSVSAVSRSCNACTSVRFAVFPSALQNSERASAEWGALGVAGAQAIPFADLVHRLRTYPKGEWKTLDFDQPGVSQTIPAAGADGAPVWVALQLNFKVRQLGVKSLEAVLGFKTPDQTTTMNSKFGVGFIGVPRFEVVPVSLDFREMGENVLGKTEEILYLSATVPQDKLSPPRCIAGGEHFLSFSPPVPLTPFELEVLVVKRSRPEVAARVLGGYKVAVTLHRKNTDPKSGPTELDIGPLAKTFTVFGATDSESQAVPVKANVTGLVALDGGATLDLGSFPAREAMAKSFSLRSDRQDLDLEVATGLTEPKVLQIELAPPINEDGRRYWSLKIRIAANATTGELDAESAVVLRAKGSGQLIRLPIKGRGFLR